MSDDEVAMTERAGSLSGWRRSDWVELAGLLGSATAAWQALSGLETGRVPSAWPDGATHLWAWDVDRWWLARQDRWGCTLSLLTEQSPVAGADASADVVFTIFEALPWESEDGRLSPVARRRRPATVTVAEVVGPRPVQFMRLEFVEHR